MYIIDNTGKKKVARNMERDMSNPYRKVLDKQTGKVKRAKENYAKKLEHKGTHKIIG